MYQHVRLKTIDRLSPGTHLLLSGTVYRHAQYTTLLAPPDVVRLIGDPFDRFLEHGQRTDVWGELLSATPPLLQVHGACPPGSTRPIPTPSRPRTGLSERVMRVTEHGAGLLGTTADQCTYQLGWPGGRAGVYVIRGHISGLSPPHLNVTSATRVWPT